MKNFLIKKLGGYTRTEMSVLENGARQMLSKVPIEMRIKLGIEKGISVDNFVYEQISSGGYNDSLKIKTSRTLDYDAKTLLIIGETGSGKNFFAQKLVKNDKKSIFFGSSVLLQEQFYNNSNDKKENHNRKNLSIKKYILNNSFEFDSIKFESDEVQDVIVIGYENILVNEKLEINIDEIRKIAFSAIKNDYNVIFSDEFMYLLPQKEIKNFLNSCHRKIINHEKDNQKLITVLNLHQVDSCFDENGNFESNIDGIVLMKGCKYDYDFIKKSSFIKEYMNHNFVPNNHLNTVGDFIFFKKFNYTNRTFSGNFVYREYK